MGRGFQTIISLFLYLGVSAPYAHALAPAKCPEHLLKRATTDVGFYRERQHEALPEAERLALCWKVTQEGLKAIDNEVKFSSSLIDGLAATILAHEFAFLTGDPGGSKSKTSRMMLEAELRSISDEEKTIFAQQFDKLLTDGVIIGFPINEKLLKTGIAEMNTSTSLVGEKYIFALLDEIEKANPATLASLLSVLNERKALLGDRVVDVLLLCAFANSNKTIGEFLASFEEDRPTGEALMDRFLLKAVVLGQTLSAAEDFALARFWLAQGKNGEPSPITALHQLNSLIKEVKIADSTIDKIAEILPELDGQFTRLADESREKIRQGEDVDEEVSASQFSIRSSKGILKMMKAAFLVKQLRDGVAPEQIRFEIQDKDLVHLAASAIYNGPGTIREKRIIVKGTAHGKLGSLIPNVDFEVDPYNYRVYYRSAEDPFKLRSFAADSATFALDDHGVIGNDTTRTDIEAALKNADRTVIQFEDDGDLQRAIDMPGIKARTKRLYQRVQTERNFFITQLNAVVSKPSPATPVEPLKEIVLDPAKLAAYKALRGKASLSNDERLEMAWLEAQLFFEESRKSYFGMDHVFKAMYVSLLTDNHLFLFGPAGGAKTSSLSYVFDAELAGMRETVAEAAKFFLQFNKLTPQAKLVGAPIMDIQIQTGERHYQPKGALVDFIYKLAILDEVEKGSPSVHTKLLSLLYERMALHGGQKLRAGLLVAALTSNKTPNEFLNAFQEDRSTGEAILARALNKVYVANKFASTRQLAEYLKRSEAGSKGPQEISTLHMQLLKPLLDKVIIPEPVLRLATNVRREYLDKRTGEADESMQKMRDDWRENPYAYEQANAGSTRNLRGDLQQWMASFLVQQLLRGKDFKDIRFTMEPQDVILLGQGLTYWAPSKPGATEEHGIIQYELGTEIDDFLGRSYIDQRQKFMLRYIKEETQDFISILNRHYINTALQMRDHAARTTFGKGLVKDAAEFAKWLKTQP